ncbi:hypothetical protein NL108_015878 [Boleophthalmus pectinirostris]|nr:hypothetical protein NL108_015878 [Boleophthalmus pectinirostris]
MFGFLSSLLSSVLLSPRLFTSPPFPPFFSPPSHSILSPFISPPFLPLSSLFSFPSLLSHSLLSPLPPFTSPLSLSPSFHLSSLSSLPLSLLSPRLSSLLSSLPLHSILPLYFPHFLLPLSSLSSLSLSSLTAAGSSFPTSVNVCAVLLFLLSLPLFISPSFPSLSLFTAGSCVCVCVCVHVCVRARTRRSPLRDDGTFQWIFGPLKTVCPLCRLTSTCPPPPSRPTPQTNAPLYGDGPALTSSPPRARRPQTSTLSPNNLQLLKRQVQKTAKCVY